jgi:hypothetical protein
VRFPVVGEALRLPACLPVLDLVDRFLRAFSNEPMRKLAKSRRYQGLLLLCLPHLMGWAYNHFYSPIMAVFIIDAIPCPDIES